MKCKDCKYWKLEDELPHITSFMECTLVDKEDPDWHLKYHFKGPEDSCERGKKKDEPLWYRINCAEF